jgi:hypothetical protein
MDDEVRGSPIRAVKLINGRSFSQRTAAELLSLRAIHPNQSAVH